MSELLTKARVSDVQIGPVLTIFLSHTVFSQTFRNRLVEVIDQAQHFAALGPAGGGGQSGDTALTFREGLEVTERERESIDLLFPSEAGTLKPVCCGKVFMLAQESAKKAKQWYESTDRLRR
jgi:GINS complex subunit 3